MQIIPLIPSTGPMVIQSKCYSTALATDVHVITGRLVDLIYSIHKIYTLDKTDWFSHDLSRHHKWDIKTK